MSSGLDINGFLLESITMEIRFGEALLLWDRAGDLWTEVSKKLPGMKLQAADPRMQQFYLNDDFELVLELKRAFVSQIRPGDDLARFSEVTTVAFDQIAKSLTIVDYSRVGFRALYWKETKDATEALELMTSSGVCLPPGHTHMLKDMQHTELEMRSQYESKTYGLSIAVRTQARTPSFNIPISARHAVTAKTDKSFGVQQDFDYYTCGITASEQLRPKVWIEQAMKAGKRGLRGLHESKSP
jgi:hypothetical protein